MAGGNPKYEGNITLPSADSEYITIRADGDEMPSIVITPRSIKIGDGVTEAVDVTASGDGATESYVDDAVSTAVSSLESYADAAAGAVDDDLVAHVGDTTDAHDASAISYAGGSSSETDVEAALDALEITSIFLPRVALSGIGGTPSGTHINNAVATLTMPDSATTHLGTSLMVPATWATYDVTVQWSSVGTAGGDVVWQFGHQQHDPAGGTASTATTTVTSVTAAAGSVAYISRVTTIASGVSVNPTFPLNIRLTRLGSDGSDTLTDAAAVVGVTVTKAS